MPLPEPLETKLSVSSMHKCFRNKVTARFSNMHEGELSAHATEVRVGNNQT